MRFYLVCLFLVLIFSCEKQEKNISINSIKEDFIGLKIGNSTFYDVRYIRHDSQVDIHDTIDFKLKSIIEDTFRDNANILRYKIHRYRWNDTIASWVNFKVISTRIDNNFYIESEDNHDVKKFFIPYNFNFSWNSNSFNANDTLHFRFINLYPKLIIGQEEVDSVIGVKQQLFISYVDLRRKYEFFARNKGMVKKYFKDLKIKKGDTTNIDKGEEWYFNMYQFIKGK